MGLTSKSRCRSICIFDLISTSFCRLGLYDLLLTSEEVFRNELWDMLGIYFNYGGLSSQKDVARVAVLEDNTAYEQWMGGGDHS